MPLTISNRFLLLVAAAALVPACGAQKYEPPPPPLTTAPCKPTKKDPCTPPPAQTAPADPFAFPGENTANVPDMPTQPANPDAPPAKLPGAPNKDTPNKDAPGAQNPFPFPGENAPDMPGSAPSSAGNSSSSSSGSSPEARNPDEPALKDEGSTGSTRFSRRRLPKVEDMGARESKDVEVANYYLNTGNLAAAYARAKDAIKIDTTDPAAHFALAVAAQRMSKPDEAREEYQAVLKNDPSDKQIKEANKALADLAK